MKILNSQNIKELIKLTFKEDGGEIGARSRFKSYREAKERRRGYIEIGKKADLKEDLTLIKLRQILERR